MHICVYACICICAVHLHMCVCFSDEFIYMHTYIIHTYIHAYMHKCICMCAVHLRARVCFSDVFIAFGMYMQVCTLIMGCVCVCVCARAGINVCALRHTQICICANMCSLSSQHTQTYCLIFYIFIKHILCKHQVSSWDIHKCTLFNRSTPAPL
jgi:hypothetical protein